LLSRGEKRGEEKGGGGGRRERGKETIGLTVVGGAGVGAIYGSPLRYSWYHAKRHHLPTSLLQIPIPTYTCT